MKLLPNINKSVPEASDPALIKPVSDAIEAVDQAIGAKPSTLTTTAKTLVGAINEIDADTDILKYRGNPTGIDANTLGTGFYLITQPSSATYNLPASYGTLVCFATPSGYRFQIFMIVQSSLMYVRSGSSPTIWNAWQTVTLT